MDPEQRNSKCLSAPCFSLALGHQLFGVWRDWYILGRPKIRKYSCPPIRSNKHFNFVIALQCYNTLPFDRFNIKKCTVISTWTIRADSLGSNCEVTIEYLMSTLLGFHMANKMRKATIRQKRPMASERANPRMA